MSATAEPSPPTQWVVYIVRCADDSLYTGITTDLTRRVEQHNAGKGARYTRSRSPVAVVYQEAVLTVGDALRRERVIKALPRTGKEQLVRAARRSA